MNHKHQWQWLLPDATEVEDKAGYMVETSLRGGILNRSVFCPMCGRTGHKINSHRGGVRLHNSTYFLDQANAIRRKYGLPLLHSEQNPERSVATEDEQN